MKLKLSFKLIATLISIFLITNVILMTIMMMQMEKAGYEKASLESVEASKGYTASFQSFIDQQAGSLTTLSSTITELQGMGNVTREDIIALVENYMQGNESVFYVNIAFEPNAYDNKDDEYQYTQLYKNEQDPGRFAISIIQSGKGSIRSPLTNLQEGDLAQFYVKTKERGELTRLDPVNYGTSSSPLLYTSINAPVYNKNNEIIGVIGYMISLSALQESAMEYTTENSSVALLSQNGYYAANGSNPELLGQRVDTAQLGDNLEKLLNGETIEIENKDTLQHFISLPFISEEDTWYVEIVTSKDYVLGDVFQARTISMIVSGITVIVFIVSSILLVRFLVLKPLNKLNGSLQQMANGDLTQRLDIRSKDEFGEMANNFNHMGNQLSDMFRHVTDLSLNVSATSQQMSASSQQTAKASENIAQAIEHVASGAEAQHNQSLTTSAEMKEMAAGIERIAESSQMAAQSSQIAEENTVVGQQKMQQTVDQMIELQQSVENSNEAVTALTAKSNEIKQITDLIAKVSQQTNLLALNAAIEASRVGEHGKGFAVVASEIRNLADQTKQANEGIAALIEEVYNDTVTASAAMENGTKQMALGIASVHEAGQIFSVINAEVQRVNEQISEVSAAAEQLHAGSVDVAATVEQFAGNANGTMNVAAEVAAASEEQLASMQEVATSSESLSVMVQELMERIARFKI